MKYLVCRTQALLPNPQLGSSLFPIVVDMDRASDPETIVRAAFDSINKGYVGMHEYLVVPLLDAMLVRFKPKQAYDT